MKRLALALLAAAALSPALSAGESATDALALRALNDREATTYLRVAPRATASNLDETRLSSFDLTGNGLADSVLVARKGTSTIVSVFISRSDAEPAYAGFTTLDSDTLPALSAQDITGDGTLELRIEGQRLDGPGNTRRTMKVAKLQDGKLGVVFASLLHSTSEAALQTSTADHHVRVRDLTGDGRHEIEVTTRRVEVIRTGAAVQEISESTHTFVSTYRWEDGRYVACNTIHLEPSPDQLLSVARRLADAGERDRAAIAAQRVLDRGGDQAVVSAARGLLNQVGANGAETAVG